MELVAQRDILVSKGYFIIVILQLRRILKEVGEKVAASIQHFTVNVVQLAGNSNNIFLSSPSLYNH